MNKFTDSKAKLLAELSLLYENKKLGYFTGYSTIDHMVGSIQKGHFWVVGGYSSVGKSYWLINVLDGLIQNQTGLKIGVFSSEMRQEDYILRHVCVKEGIWEGNIETSYNKKELIERLATGIKNYDKSFNGNEVDIIGNTYSMETIWEHSLKNKYDVVCVDYVNKLSCGTTYTEDKAMPLVAKSLDKLSKSENTAVIALSQVNLSSVNKDYDSEKTSPFSWGKNLYESCDVGILLERDKAENKLSSLLKIRMVKHRRKELLVGFLKINAGYKLTTPTEGDLINQ